MPSRKVASPRRHDTFTLVLMILAGAYLGALAMNGHYNRAHPWNRVMTPVNETVTEIVALNDALMPYVRTQQGNLYLCSGSNQPDACMPSAPAELPASAVPPSWLTCPPPFPQTPPLLGTVVEAIEAGQCAETKTYAKVIRMDDGTVWQWRRTYSGAEPFTVVLAALVGMGIGLVSGLLTVRMRGYLRSN